MAPGAYGGSAPRKEAYPVQYQENSTKPLYCDDQYLDSNFCEGLASAKGRPEADSNIYFVTDEVIKTNNGEPGQEVWMIGFCEYGCNHQPDDAADFCNPPTNKPQENPCHTDQECSDKDLKEADVGILTRGFDNNGHNPEGVFQCTTTTRATAKAAA